MSVNEGSLQVTDDIEVIMKKYCSSTKRHRLGTDKFPMLSVGWSWQGFCRDLDPCWSEWRVVIMMYGHTYSKSMDQPGEVANPARGQLNREKNISLSAFAPENLVPRNGFGSPVPRRQPSHLHTQAESCAYGIPPEFRGGVHLFNLNRHTPSGQSRVYRVIT